MEYDYFSYFVDLNRINRNKFKVGANRSGFGSAFLVRSGPNSVWIWTSEHP